MTRKVRPVASRYVVGDAEGQTRCVALRREHLEYDLRKSREYMWLASVHGFAPAMTEVGDVFGDFIRRPAAWK